ncbi:cystathionine beta-lyase [Indioceanicola profundi]|uniref:cystathionine beta-lyase n=1 Tax=Indioceanicola profundi TaxID=2220096 RepID=UPI000E6AD1F9|nr:cystathionine beta-lyase [Indioceanicola profundi]
MSKDETRGGSPTTRLSHGGRKQAYAGAVNVPPFRASTILFDDVDHLNRADPDWLETRYGRIGNPSSRAFEEAMAELEGGYRAVSFGSGLQAITTALLAFCKAGDHLLVTDSCYGPTREFCRQMLAGLGVEVEFYDPLIGAGIEALFRPNTRALFLESPGSLSFEVQDVPAMTAAARARGIVTLLDNTWAAGWFYRPLKHGVDVSIQAATKFIAGHADANLGVAVCTEDAFRPVKTAAVLLGACAGSEDLYLGLRGIRTLGLRMERHQRTGLALAQWLASRPEVARILYPARPEDPGHSLWKRDFTGASGLFTVELKPVPRRAVSAMVDALTLFGIGFSYGGFESLVLPTNPAKSRSATEFKAEGPLVRIHCGLEEPADLIADLEKGFAIMETAQ